MEIYRRIAQNIPLTPSKGELAFDQGEDALEKHLIDLGFNQKQRLGKVEGKTISRQNLVFHA